MRIEHQDFEFNAISGKLDLVVRDSVNSGPLLAPAGGIIYVYIPGVDKSFSATTLTAAADRLIAIPFPVHRRCQLSAVYAQVTTAATGVMKLAVYDSNAIYYPSTLIQGSSDIGTSSTGLKTWSPVNLILDPGMYFLAAHWSASPTMRAVPIANVARFYGFSTDLATALGVFWQTTSEYGSGLPSAFPSGATLQTTAMYAIGVAVSNPG